MAKGCCEITLEAEVDGYDQLVKDVEHLGKLLDEVNEIIERLGESKVTIRVRPSRQQ